MFNSLESWLQFLEKLHFKNIDLSLERIQRVAHQLGIRLPGFVITVGGTNGKGSCVALLESILLNAGYTVGAYFSPHLISFCERARINGREVSTEIFCEAFSIINQARKDITLTYFEFTTLAVLYLFQQAALEFLLLEVGMGGRYDAVNILDPDIALITSISLDHTNYLGSNCNSIAREKAGIFRRNQKVVYGDPVIWPSLLEEVKSLECQLYSQNRDFFYMQHEKHWDFVGGKERKNLPYPSIALQNAASVLQAISLLLPSYSIPNKAVIQGLKKINLKGRFQRIQHKSVHFTLDVAHNPASAILLAENFKKIKNSKRRYALVGMLIDKDHQATLAPLVPFIDAWWVTALPGERGASAEHLGQCLKKITKTPILLFSQLKQAYDNLICHLEPTDDVLVFGSFLTVGGVLKILEEDLEGLL
ncbi:MAG: hypothetical protein A3I12_05490 [Gammaproteobacteria bacterium RIFCSPLOWO2_02_FULL_38_11]|nr:MAG: hypothetical protein A3B69_04255 [Gammaproteobacteria bacterium RIFCSPHIGHO2_02_FULL_38_33]OGT23969.1 MAG: hypothetical protein A2W47_01485 [Gammaproteobacteria bacterium RIFCSPHIGHO2_12_38_15]OGT68001.1 MAG: hypothetical protein A3I12_05490 [Gammaproteobacteria bacterium RIFCSPLOWO2_02_FULL_38_11]OGT76638.1 MAG: hypothetical protein A3G71_02525 [Gammaproteobacteria bacterium RIFCSPLOWO2_12_FULL_38_14]